MRPVCRARSARHLIASSLLVVVLAGFSPADGFGPPVPAAPYGSGSTWASPSRVDGDQLIDDLRTLASSEMEGRLTGTAGSRRAQAYITDRFRRLRLQPVGESYEQPFAFAPARAQGAEGGQGTNLLALIPGRRDPERVVLVSAHYDHVGIRGGVVYPGADDNASGVAALLAIAAWFARHPPDLSIVLVAFDAEEQGLAGSKRFVANPPLDLDRIAVVVNMDMVGRGDDETLIVAGTHYSPALAAVVEAAAKGRELTVRFGHDRPSSQTGGEADWTHASDHGPFHSAGVPFLYFAVADHRDYHRPTDTADRIPRRFFVEATEVMLETVRRLAGPAEP